MFIETRVKAAVAAAAVGAVEALIVVGAVAGRRRDDNNRALSEDEDGGAADVGGGVSGLATTTGSRDASPVKWPMCRDTLGGAAVDEVGVGAATIHGEHRR